MQLARVVGEVVATRKDDNLTSIALLLIQPIDGDGNNVGKPIVATDSRGAGPGEHVFFVRGKEASFPFNPGDTPTDAAIIGIVDYWDTTTTHHKG
jgi:microcompartment protein CcmK/EutM